MKTSKKIVLTALSATLAASLTSGIALTAFADEATKDHVYEAKFDKVFEDFDRADISDTVSTEGTGVSLGEKPHMHVTYTADGSITPGNAIYKQGSPLLNNVASSSGSISLELRAPNGDVDLSELIFAVRSPNYDDDGKVVTKSFTELKDSQGHALTALTTGWQTYEIAFTTSYGASDKYKDNDDDEGVTVTGSNLAAFHVYATEGSTGTLDIGSITYKVGAAEKPLNYFTGGNTAAETAEAAAASVGEKLGWNWAGSHEGVIVKRKVNMTGGSLQVVKGEAVGDYKYAVIEVEGDKANLKVATTTDGTTWGTPVAYDGYSVNLNGNEKGFKFIYNGSDANGVTVKRIYLTNLVKEKPATAVPVIDATTADVLEDFSVAQNGFTGDYDAMKAATAAAGATDLEYRLSYQNGNKVEVKDGALVFDGLGTEGANLIRFKFLAKHAHKGNYVVLKVKGEDGASFDNFRFSLIDAQGVGDKEAWSHNWKSGVDFNAATALDNTNPYKTSDGWYYIVIDIERSGMKVCEDGYSGIEFFYQNVGKLYIDNVFFADEVAKVPTDCVKNIKNEAGDGPFALDFKATSTNGYQYGCEVKGLDGTPDFYNVLAMDIEIAEGTDLSGVRFAFGSNERWAGGLGDHDDKGYLYLTDGTLLANAGFVAGTPKTVYIDLEKSDITVSNFHIHTSGTDTGSFKITNAKLLDMTSVSELKVPDSQNAYTVKNEAGDAPFELDFVATSTNGYQYGCEVKGLDDLDETYDVLAMDIDIADGTDLSGVRFAFGGNERYAGGFGDHDGYLYLTDGTLLANAGFVAGTPKTVYIDLEKSNITLSNFHIHTNGTATGSFKITNAKLMKYTASPAVAEAYAEQIALLPLYLDTVKPTVSISTKTTATAGDEITVAYTVSDDKTQTADLTVSVSVTKDGNPVTLTNNKFTAEEGVYTVTVTVTDMAGNEESDTIQITVSAASSTGTGNNEKDGLSGGAIAGIVIGCVAAVALVGGAVFFIIKKKKNG